MRGSSNGMSVRVERFPEPFASGASGASESTAKTDHQPDASFETVIGRIRASSKDTAEPVDDQRAARSRQRRDSSSAASARSERENVSPEERPISPVKAESADGGAANAATLSRSDQENEEEAWQDQPALAGFFAPSLLQYALPGNSQTAAGNSAGADAGVGASKTELPGNPPVIGEDPQLVTPYGPRQDTSAGSQNLTPNAASTFVLTDSAAPMPAAPSRQLSGSELSDKAPVSPLSGLDWMNGSAAWILPMRQAASRFTQSSDSTQSGATASVADRAAAQSALDGTQSGNPPRNAAIDGSSEDPVFKGVEVVQSGCREAVQTGVSKTLLDDSKTRTESVFSQDLRRAGGMQVSENSASGQAAAIPAAPSVQPDQVPVNPNIRNDAGTLSRQSSWRAKENPAAKSPADDQTDGTAAAASGGRKDGAIAETSSTLKVSTRESRDPQVQAAPGFRAAAGADDVPVSKAQQTGAPRQPDMIFQLADRIRAQVQNGRTELTIQLKPESLGKMEIRAEAGVHGLVARIVTETASVKHYLESNLSVLQQNLHDQGLKIERIDFIVQDGIDGRLYGGQQNAGQTADGQQGGDSGGHSGSSPAARMAVDDEIVADPAAMASLGPNSTFHTVA